MQLTGRARNVRISFVERDGGIRVSTDLVNNGRVKNGFHGFHGFHVHANNLPDGGTGCVADANQPSSTWFVSADGHMSGEGQSHGSHTGDMPSVLAQDDGTARLQFSTRAFSLKDLEGKAVVLHAGADNFGNVPLGDAADQYKANSADATTKTGKTGNAGDRIACGLVEVTGASGGAPGKAVPEDDSETDTLGGGQVAVKPSGGADTGGGSTAGTENAWLFGLGAAAIATGAVAFAAAGRGSRRSS